MREGPRLEVAHEGELHVEHLGEFDLPEIRLDDGSQPHGIRCRSDNPAIAHIDGGRILIHGPGRTQVRCGWEDQLVVFPLEVQLATVLSFVDAPAVIPMGRPVALQLRAWHGERALALGQVTWESSNQDIVAVANGRVEGRSPGVAYVTARARGATAQLELTVVTNRALD